MLHMMRPVRTRENRLQRSCHQRYQNKFSKFVSTSVQTAAAPTIGSVSSYGVNPSTTEHGRDASSVPLNGDELQATETTMTRAIVSPIIMPTSKSDKELRQNNDRLL